MCFHSKQSKSAQTVENRFDAKIEQIGEFKPSEHFNGFAYPKTPVILDQNVKTIEHLNWGLIPHWANDNSIRKGTLNARIETIKEKPSFKDVVNSRCLVISDGFYEWKWLDPKGENKQKHLISLEDNGLYAYAGIYSEWMDRSTSEVIKTYSIVTTEANPLVAEIHQKKRMPIILKEEDEMDWLNGREVEDFKYPYSENLKCRNLSTISNIFLDL